MATEAEKRKLDELKKHGEEAGQALQKIVHEHIVRIEDGKKEPQGQPNPELVNEALDQFEQEKELLLEQADRLGYKLSESDISNPYDLEFHKGRISLLEENKPQQKPTGKVRFTGNQNPNQAEQWENPQAMVEALVQRKELAEIESLKKNPNAEVVKAGKKAEEMIEKLWASAMEGKRPLTLQRKLTWEENPKDVNPNYEPDIKKLKLMR